MVASHQFRVVKTNLTHIHGWCLLQVVPWCINHINIIYLITYNKKQDRCVRLKADQEGTQQIHVKYDNAP